MCIFSVLSQNIEKVAILIYRDYTFKEENTEVLILKEFSQRVW